jgi:hypothetical protein
LIRIGLGYVGKVRVALDEKKFCVGFEGLICYASAEVQQVSGVKN